MEKLTKKDKEKKSSDDLFIPISASSFSETLEGTDGIKEEYDESNYWEKFRLSPEGENAKGVAITDFNNDSDIAIDVNIKFYGLNGIIYETNQEKINCNPTDLATFFEDLKKTIARVDLTMCDRISDHPTR